MVKYLALDFGTTNCLAAWVDNENVLSLISLEEDSAILPSAIFSKYLNPSPKTISHTEFQRKLAEAVSAECLRLKNQEQDILGQLDIFRKLTGPRRSEPKRSEFRDRVKFEAALSDFIIGLPSLPKRIKNFESTAVVTKEAELRSFQLPGQTDDEIERRVTFVLERELMESRARVYEDLNFFSSLRDDRFVTLYGSEAIAAYVNDPLGGFFMRSPKAFLGSKLEGGRQAVFADIVSKVLNEVKRRAQLKTGANFDGIVIGRPINFLGSAHGGSNEQAVSIMKLAARNAGFSQTRFVMEPFAAALVIGNTMFDVNYPALIVDVGGGTTDIAYFGVERDALVKLNIQSTAGERIGGSDFDQSLALNRIGPVLGKGTMTKDGVPIPTKYYDAAFSTRDLEKQIEFRKSGQQIEALVGQAMEPVKVGRLNEVYRDQLQHSLLLDAERAKIALTKNSDFKLTMNCFTIPADVIFTKNDVAQSCSGSVAKIREMVQNAISCAKTPNSPVRVFLTGGMSYSEEVIGAVRDVIPVRSTIARLPAFQSIIAGLAMVAHQLSMSTSIAAEPRNYRGIPIED